MQRFIRSAIKDKIAYCDERALAYLPKDQSEVDGCFACDYGMRFAGAAARLREYQAAHFGSVSK
jgi:hypothetical protein